MSLAMDLVWYVEVKMVPMDAVWLFLLLMYIAFAYHFKATHPPIL